MITFILERIIRFLLSAVNILSDYGVEAGVGRLTFTYLHRPVAALAYNRQILKL